MHKTLKLIFDWKKNLLINLFTKLTRSNKFFDFKLTARAHSKIMLPTEISIGSQPKNKKNQ